MQLQGKKIFLRSVQPSDADILYKWENDKSYWQVSGTKKSFTKKEIQDFISNQKDIYLDKQLRLMICTSPLNPLSRWRGEKGTGVVRGEVVGCIDLFNFNEPNLTAGIGILIDKKYRKKGYASDALSLLIKYSFEILNLNQLHCNISEENKASIKLFQKHKFKIIEKKNGLHSLQLNSSLRGAK